MTRFLTATAMAIVATAAMAAQPAPPAAPIAPIAPVAPSVGKVMERGEVQAKVREHFTRLDANKDGAITTVEIAEHHGAKGHHKMGHGMDHDGPGAKMHAGPMRDPAAAFDRLDTNKDGMISRDEFAKGREIRIEKRIVMHGGDAGAAAKSGAKHAIRMHRMGGGMGGGHMIVMADTDKDGRITLAEAEAMALQHFDKMDANRDGKVTPEERRAGRPMIMKMRMAPKAG